MSRQRGLWHVHRLRQLAHTPWAFMKFVQNEDSFWVTNPLADLLIQEVSLLLKLFIHQRRSLLFASRSSLENEDKEPSRTDPPPTTSNALLCHGGEDFPFLL
jgi:hypothetical protein